MAVGLVALVPMPFEAAAQGQSVLIDLSSAAPVIYAPLEAGPRRIPRSMMAPRTDLRAPVPIPAATWVSQKHWGLAIPGALGGNIIPMVYNEFVQPWKEISRTSPHSWTLYWNVQSQWEWDDNHFFNNQLFHPIQGNFYYNGGRANGFSYWWSAAFTLVGSYLWECCGERRPGSYNDWATTTLGGVAVGEIMFRSTSLFLDNEASGIDRWGLEGLVLPLNIERFASRGVYDRWHNAPNPAGRKPLEWGMALGSGLRWTGGRPHAVLDVELRYGALFGLPVADPFDYFSVNLQLNGRDEPIGLVQISGHLWQHVFASTPAPPPPPEEQVLTSIQQQQQQPSIASTRAQLPAPYSRSWRWYVAQNYDYLDSSPDPGLTPASEYGYRYGGQSVGLGLAGDFGVGALRVTSQLQGDLVPIGAVNSIHSTYQGQIPERVREYDFGVGAGGRAKLGVRWPGFGRLNGGYQFAWLRTLSGSRCNYPGCQNESSHWMQAATVSVKLELDEIFDFVTRMNNSAPWAEDMWIGGDFFWFKKDTSHTNAAFADEHTRQTQWRVIVSWDITRGALP